MKKVIKRIFVLSLVMVLTFSFSFESYATTVDEVKDKISDLEKEKQQIQQNIANLEKQTGDISVYIEELDKQLSELSSKIDTLSGQITNTKANLEKNQKELALAKTDLSGQYDVMKARVKYMYENGSDDYMDMLLQASSITELLNRAEYINKISKYDQNLYGNYDNTVKLIATKQQQIKESLETLNTLQQKLELEKDGVNTLLENKKTQLDNYKKKISEAKVDVNNKQQQIEEENEVVEQLLEEARKKAEAEEAARKKAEEEARKKAEEEKKKQEAAEQAAKEEADKNNNSSSNNSSSNNSQGSSGNSSSSSDGSSSNTSSSSLRWPLNTSGRITSTFGYRESPTAGASSYHKGIDIGIPTGTSVVAAGSGTVVVSQYHYSAGNYVMINHGNGLYTVYMHNSSLKVSVGDHVSKGQVIALSGSTGVSTGPHLHFGVSKNGTYVNPLNYVSMP
ncbi:MAG: peptidoglycan DD-metalloendopeptidase family protein [bacterium]|nr:peptidoglycan DD-metalloendopeptidase family protein [bacterium]